MSKVIGNLQLFEWSVTYKPDTFGDKSYTGAISAHNYQVEEYYNRRKSFKTYNEAYNWVQDIIKKESQ